MENINRALLQFFTEHYKPGTIGVVGTKHTLGMAIREAQKRIPPDGKPSPWSHAFIFGDMRLDRRGPAGKVSRSPYIFESNLKVNPVRRTSPF